MLRLNKVIARASSLSRRKSDKAILDGEVTINGSIELNPSIKIDPENSDIRLNGRKLLWKTANYYFMVNKPKGYLSTRSDDRNRATVMDLLPDIHGLFPVGRLDMNTCGLILITNDGDFSNHLCHPSNNIRKVYQVRLSRELADWEFDGIVARRNKGGGKEGARKFRKISAKFYEIILVEGAKHQIRNIFAKINVEVAELKRIAIGPLNIGNLPEGGYRPLFQKEINDLERAGSKQE
jgi:23S rRNA pseudouridine2605 synthase